MQGSEAQGDKNAGIKRERWQTIREITDQTEDSKSTTVSFQAQTDWKTKPGI